ncbi:MAG: response regulator [bacterium]|nr:response regulator [bacterium]
MAHDFNNILTPILGYAEIARMEKDLHGNLRGHLEMIIQAALRAKDLVKQILTFSRQGDQERQPFHLQIIVKEVMKLMRAAIPSTVTIVEDIDGKCDLVECDPTQIHQVLVNLATNAFHAMRARGGTLEVKLSMIEADSKFSCLHVNLAEGRYARLTVSDTGHGMDKATVERIFEPFYTTKDAGEGTGLGLSVVHGIVTAHGGGISVYSEPGNGTTFQIYLPCSDQAKQTEQVVDAPPLSGTEHVLFVDDERPNILMGKQILEHLGYSVTICESPLDALEHLKAEPGKFDLLITDQTMPQMTGDELLTACRELRPDIPAILLTGFSDTVTAKNFGDYGFNAFGMKPIILKDFSRIVRKALQHSTAVA